MIKFVRNKFKIIKSSQKSLKMIKIVENITKLVELSRKLAQVPTYRKIGLKCVKIVKNRKK